MNGQIFEIGRPPAHLPTFAMPSKKELEMLAVRVAQQNAIKTLADIKKKANAKVIFVQGMHVERMWTTPLYIDNNGWVKAELENNPLGISGVHIGDQITFHVTDIIAID